MSYEPLDSVQLRTLAEIIRRGSFEAAAQALGITQSAVSQRLKALEDRVGTTLVVRGTPNRATEAGRRLFSHAEDLALLESALARDLGLPGPAPVLRIAVNADSVATWFLPALAQAGEALFELLIDDQDHSAELLRRGEVVAAVSAHPGPVQGCDTRPLGALRYVATASPEFARRWFGQGVTAQALAVAPRLVFDEKDQLQSGWIAARLGRPVSGPSHRLPSSNAFVEAALLGLGWGMNPETLVTGHIAAGRLVELSPGHPFQTPLFWQSSRVARPALSGLTAAIRAQARRALHRDTAGG